MNKHCFLLLIFILLAVSFSAVFADSDGRVNWCNSDDYGCWVRDEDGGQCYIMFWSEEARQYFMGSSTAPYTNVVDRCLDCGGKLTMESFEKNYINEFIALLEKCGETVEGEIEYYKTHNVFISKEEYLYAVKWYKEHGCSI